MIIRSGNGGSFYCELESKSEPSLIKCKNFFRKIKNAVSFRVQIVQNHKRKGKKKKRKKKKRKIARIFCM